MQAQSASVSFHPAAQHRPIKLSRRPIQVIESEFFLHASADAQARYLALCRKLPQVEGTVAR